MSLFPKKKKKEKKKWSIPLNMSACRAYVAL